MSITDHFRDTFRQVVGETTDPAPAVFVSAGCDSNALLLALVEHGARPTVFTFTLNDRSSRDSEAAQENARRLGLNCHLVRLPANEEWLAVEARQAIRSGARGKANIEVLVPFRSLLMAAWQHGFRTALTGVQADCHFGVTRKEIINLRHSTIEEFDAHRREYFATKVPVQNGLIAAHGRTLDVKVLFPYADQRICDVFLGHTWAELNKPRQKEAIRSFPGLERLDVDRVRSNIQLGDGGGVAGVLARLLDDPDTNPRGYKRMTGLYNSWAAA